jgi:hypothetical protein
MATDHTTGSGDAVALTISAEDSKFLRSVFTMALQGIRDELADYPDDLDEPTHLRREEGVYEKLLAALDCGRIVPDHYTRQVLGDLAEMNDRENEYARAVAEHDALLGLRDQLGRGESR